ncbi:MAG: D-2-hydroxyacid dehydrogenase [Clostridia bacterium]|nr:D-2-hydroxyacid dehydrogenase [Clostridia bacterium]
MAEIRKVLCTTKLKEENRERLLAALAPAEVTFVNYDDPGAKDRIAEVGADVDVAIFNGDLERSILKNSNLKWIHCCHAGLEKSTFPEIFDRNIILTGSSGRSAPALAEHALMFMLALTYDLMELRKAQQAHYWAQSAEYDKITGLHGKTVGIIGMGKTGLELARLCKGFDMRVLGWKRTHAEVANVDKIYASAKGEGIEEILKESDYIVLCVELHDDTWHLIDRKELEMMKPSAFLINMGRGGLINEKVLINALENRTIKGAGLDTFEVEPLPADNRLWDLENVIITPHTTPKLIDREERMLSYLFQNIEVYRNGGEFVNRVTRKSLYTKKFSKVE